jgi:hypothetical protein
MWKIYTVIGLIISIPYTINNLPADSLQPKTSLAILTPKSVETMLQITTHYLQQPIINARNQNLIANLCIGLYCTIFVTDQDTPKTINNK